MSEDTELLMALVAHYAKAVLLAFDDENIDSEGLVAALNAGLVAKGWRLVREQ